MASRGVPPAHLAQRVEHRARGGRLMGLDDGGLDVTHRGGAGQRHGGHLSRVDDHVEPVGERDAAAGGHEGLRLDRLVTVARVEQLGLQPGRAEHVIDQPGGGALMRTDPGLAGQLGGPDGTRPGEPMATRQQDAQRIVEQRDQLDPGRHGGGLEGVLEHDRDVQLGGRQAAECRGAVDEHVLTEHGAPAALAAIAFTAFALALAAGRLAGDRLVTRHGRSRVVQVSATTTAAGATLVVIAPGATPALTGWALFGLGLATVAPTLLGAAPGATTAPPATAIAAVTTIGYLGSFTGPPAIGGLAQATSLSTALLTLVAASLVLAALATPALTERL
jgi:hypothetical protein